VKVLFIIIYADGEFFTISFFNEFLLDSVVEWLDNTRSGGVVELGLHFEGNAAKKIKFRLVRENIFFPFYLRSISDDKGLELVDLVTHLVRKEGDFSPNSSSVIIFRYFSSIDGKF
jgi:hypothetical protein